MSVDDVWGGLADRFVEAHYGSITGRARTYVIDQHLREHLPAPPARVADVGAGAGNQSIPLARRGYEVTLLDSSAGMLARAEEALATEPPAVRARVTLVHGDAEQAGARLRVEPFAAVLCHGVLLYVEDPAPLVGELAGLVAPGGVLSIVTKNRATLAVGPAQRKEWAAALEAFDADREVNRLGLETRADTVAGVEALLRANGIEPTAWYGVRLFADNWTGPEPDPADEPAIMAVELEASRRDPYRAFSRLFHLVGRKRP